MKARTVIELVVWAGLLGVASTARADGPADERLAAAMEREDYTRAAELLRAEVERAPEDEAARFMLARVLGWSGDHAAALSQYDALIAASPQNVDYSFGRAQVLAWAQRDELALAELSRARALAPSYEAVWRLELAVLRRSRGAAQRLAEFRAAAARRFPEADWWSEPSSPAEPGTEIAFAAAHQSLSRPVPDWSTLSVRVTRRLGADSTFLGVVEREDRFGRRDVTIAAGASFRPAERWSVGGDLGLGPNAGFMPSVSANAWASRAFESGWETRFGLRHRRYDTAEVTSGAATIGRYFGSFRAAYTLDHSRLHGAETSLAHSATLSYYRSESTRFDVTIAAGQEAEATAPGVVLRTDVTAFSVGARHDLSGRWAVSWWLGAHRQGELYRRRYVGFSLATGF